MLAIGASSPASARQTGSTFIAEACRLPSIAAWPWLLTPICCGARRSEPNLDEARQFANAIHARFPGKMLAYNCSPSIQWRAKLNEDDIACFQRDLAAMGYRFQFVTLAGFHALNLSMYHLAKDYLHARA